MCLQARFVDKRALQAQCYIYSRWQPLNVKNKLILPYYWPASEFLEKLLKIPCYGVQLTLFEGVVHWLQGEPILKSSVWFHMRCPQVFHVRCKAFIKPQSENVINIFYLDSAIMKSFV